MGRVLVGVLVLSWGLSGCREGCDQETTDRAVAFMDAHQSCQSSDDCVVVGDHCGELPRGYCGQLAMNREGAESAEWQELEEELADCAPETCTVCLAQLVPGCAEGSCRPPE